MTTAEKVVLGSAVVSFLSFIGSTIFAVLSVFARRGAKKQADRANDIAVGQAETGLRDNIDVARQRIEDASLRIADLLGGRKPDRLNADEKRHLDVMEKARASAIEGFLNRYEDACSKYIDDKIDRERFRKMYFKEIANLCDPNVASYATHMHPESTCRFEAIWKVYKEWHRLEK